MKCNLYIKMLTLGLIILLLGSNGIQFAGGFFCNKISNSYDILDIKNIDRNYGGDKVIVKWMNLNVNKTSDGEIIINNNLLLSKIKNDSHYKFYNNYIYTHKNSYTENIKTTAVLSSEDFYLTQPLNNDIFRAGDIIYINGTIDIEGLKQYKVEYGQGKIPIKWYTKGITLVNNGSSPIIDNTVAIWDTSSIEKPDYFTLRITTYRKNILKLPYFLINNLFHSKNKILSLFFDEICNVEDRCIGRKKTNYIKNIYLDPTLKEGWPKRLHWDYDEIEGCYYWGGILEAVVSDIDNDAEMEILVYMGGKPPKIYAFNPDGSNVDGWPVYVYGEDLPGGVIASPSIADINDDGYKEIFVNGAKGIYIYNYAGELFKLINLSLCCQPTSESLLFDLNNDGKFEIVKKFDQLKFPSQQIAILDIDGNIMNNWPQSYYNESGPTWFVKFSYATQAVGNFDEDPEKEFVLVTNRNVFDDPNNIDTLHIEGRVFVYNLDGSILDGFPVDIDGGMSYSSPAVGDINNDGQDEIVIATTKSLCWNGDEGYPNSGLYVLDRSGSVVNGWPKLIGKSIFTSPAIADFNNDGYLEIVVSTVDRP